MRRRTAPDPRGDGAPELSDEALCDLARAGASWPLEELWDRHFSMTRAWAMKKDPDAGEDATAEAFTRVFQALRSGVGPMTSFRGYLFKTVDSALVKHWNTSRRFSPLDDLGEFADDDTPDHADVLTEDEERKAAAVALQDIPERWREIILAVDVERRPVQEVAAELGLTPNSASVLLKRARAGLRKAWMERMHTPTESLPHDCATAVRHFGTLRWGKQGTRVRSSTERHLETCESCPSRYRLFLERATTVGLGLTALLTLTRGWRDKFVPALATSATIVASFSVTVSLEPLFDPPVVAEPATPSEAPHETDGGDVGTGSDREPSKPDTDERATAVTPVEVDDPAPLDDSPELPTEPDESETQGPTDPATNEPQEIADDGMLYFGDWTGWDEDTETFTTETE